jgi:hypothetical protein
LLATPDAAIFASIAAFHCQTPRASHAVADIISPYAFAAAIDTPSLFSPYADIFRCSHISDFRHS